MEYESTVLPTELYHTKKPKLLTVWVLNSLYMYILKVIQNPELHSFLTYAAGHTPNVLIWLSRLIECKSVFIIIYVL